MKLRLSALTMTAALAALPLMAQDAPPPPAPPPKPAPAPAPAPPVPSPTTAAELLPKPETPPVDIPDNFKSEKERQSYALGAFFATREKNTASAGGTPLPNIDEVIAGLNDVLGGSKSVDYAVGAQLAVQIRRAEVDIDPAVLSDAVREAMSGQPPKLTPQQQQMVMQRIQSELGQRADAKRKAEAAKALVVANEFMAENAKAEGVKQTESGLQYKIETEGEGKSPGNNDLAMLNFKGTLLDGSVFDRSPDTGPARKPVKVLPKGLQEGLAMLKTGGKAKFWVPPAIGHGEMGRAPHVKSNAVLLYDVELVSVEPLPKQPTAATQPTRPPITAVTPPITVEIPPKPGDKPAEPPKPDAPKPDAPKPPDAPPPAPPAKPESK